MGPNVTSGIIWVTEQQMVGYAQNSVENIKIDESHFSSMHFCWNHCHFVISLLFHLYLSTCCSNFNLVFFFFCFYYYRLQNDIIL